MPKPISKLAVTLLLALAPPLSAQAIPFAYAAASAGSESEDLLTEGASFAQASDGNGAASAAIDLSLGLLRASATSTLAPSPSGQAVGVVEGWDRFTVLGYPQGTIVDFTVSLHVTGTLDAIQTTWGAESGAAIYVDLHRADSFEIPSLPAFQLGRHDSNSDPEQLEVDQMVSRTYQVLAGVPFGLSLYMLASSNGTAISDFSHTAQLNFDLPEGASVVSDAGYHSVPEPGADLLLPAACAVAFLRRLAARRIPRRA